MLTGPGPMMSDDLCLDELFFLMLNRLVFGLRSISRFLSPSSWWDHLAFERKKETKRETEKHISVCPCEVPHTEVSRYSLCLGSVEDEEDGDDEEASDEDE